MDGDDPDGPCVAVPRARGGAARWGAGVADRLSVWAVAVQGACPVWPWAGRRHRVRAALAVHSTYYFKRSTGLESDP